MTVAPCKLKLGSASLSQHRSRRGDPCRSHRDNQSRRHGRGADLVEAILHACAPQDLAGTRSGLTLVVYRERRFEDREGFAHNGDRPFYPCSVVKMFWMATCLSAHRSRERVRPHDELDRALHDMVGVVEQHGDELRHRPGDRNDGRHPARGRRNSRTGSPRRSWANEWLRSLEIPEFQAINVCQKNRWTTTATAASSRSTPSATTA